MSHLQYFSVHLLAVGQLMPVKRPTFSASGLLHTDRRGKKSDSVRHISPAISRHLPPCSRDSPRRLGLRGLPGRGCMKGKSLTPNGVWPAWLASLQRADTANSLPHSFKPPCTVPVSFSVLLPACSWTVLPPCLRQGPAQGQRIAWSVRFSTPTST